MSTIESIKKDIYLLKGGEFEMALKKRNKIWVFIFIVLAILLVFYLIGAFIFNGMKG